MIKPVFWQLPAVHFSKVEVDSLVEKLRTRLKSITEEYSTVKFATSLAAEDMVLTDAIASFKLPIQLFTLNTGRLHASTVAMIERVQNHYGAQIEILYPEENEVASYIEHYGLNGFYETEDAKKTCCGVRKVKPLYRALAGADAWLSGQRRAQALTRTTLEFKELDIDRNLMKFNPIFDFSEEDLWAYLTLRDVPIHPLHLEGYPSIGCEPCTRPVKQGEDIRAGRWWWLHSESKECGLHVKEMSNESNE